MAIKVEQKKNESEEDAKARAFIKPSLRSGVTMSAFTIKGFETNVGSLVDQLDTLCKDDNFNAENMLIAQAHTLDAIFNNLAFMASNNINNNFDAADSLLKLALRAQNQCGKTLQVILQNQQSKLLTGVKNGESLDSGTAIDAIPSNKKMATLVAIDGGKNRRRKKDSLAECV